MRQIIAAGLVLMAVYACLRMADNELHRSAPPPACQLLGGSWGIWSGWSCG